METVKISFEKFESAMSDRRIMFNDLAYRDTCEKCRKKIKAENCAWLELSSSDGSYYLDIPSGHHSQGFFSFHTSCAKDLLKITAGVLPSESVEQRLSTQAWMARNNAIVNGSTKVGAAVITQDGWIFKGCNVGSNFRNDIHAEVSAISALVGQGFKTFTAILVVAERERFTPCGACMDWIMKLGGPDTLVGFQHELYGHIEWLTARELMPHYPH